jgi:hypothetical protein
LDIDKDKKKSNNMHAVGGCLALVYLMKNCLDKAIDKIPACDQVTKLNESPVLETLLNTLGVIVTLVCTHKENRVGICLVGGVEAVVKVMKTFPKCELLQVCACSTLGNLAFCTLGKKKSVETGAMEFLVAAVNNHLDSARVCDFACWAFYSLITANKESTNIFLSSGGVTAVTKVRVPWPEDEIVQEVMKLTKPIVKELNSWSPIEKDKRRSVFSCVGVM